MTEFKTSFSLQTHPPNASSVIVGADGTSDLNEARYWYQSFGLGNSRKYSTASLRRVSHVRRVTLRPDVSSATVAMMIQQVVFGPSTYSKSTPLAVVAGPRVSLYGTSPSSLLHQTLARHDSQLQRRDDDDDDDDDDSNSSDDEDISNNNNNNHNHNKHFEPDRNVPTGGVPALSCSFRSDGRLLAIGTSVGQVRVCDATSRVTLRTFVTDAKLPIRTVAWLRNGQHILSGGDDGLLRIWSLSGTTATTTTAANSMTTAPILTLSGHGDAIRAAVLWQQPAADIMADAAVVTNKKTSSPSSSSTWTQLAMSGSYDHTIRIWNVEHLVGSDNHNSNDEDRCISILSHGAPVEALLLMPGGGGGGGGGSGDATKTGGTTTTIASNNAPPVWLLSAGGTSIKVWNPWSGTCVFTVTNTQHRKTITCLLPMKRIVHHHHHHHHHHHDNHHTSDGTTTTKSSWRILTGGLDGLCRIYTWLPNTGRMMEFLHGFAISQGPITSLAVNETYDRLAIGTSTGHVIIRQKGPSSSITPHKRLREPRAGTYAFFTRGKNVSVSDLLYSQQQQQQQPPPHESQPQDYVAVAEGKKRKLRTFDIKLKQFRYGDALDEALETRQPQAVMAVLEELGKRRGLVAALSHRDEESLEPILSFCVRYMTRPKYSMVLMGVAHHLLDIYASVHGQSETVDDLFHKLREQVQQECRAQKSLLRLMGQLDGFLTTGELLER